MVEAPPVQKHPTLRLPALMLAIVAIGWLVAWVLDSGPREDLLLGIGVLLATPVLAVAWLLLVLLRFGLRRRIGVVGWLAVPCIFVAAWFLPWSDWQFRRAFHRAEPALVAMVAEFQSLPIGEKVTVRRQVGPFAIEWVTRFEGGTIFTTSLSPDGESGLVYSTSGSLPTRPEWVVTQSMRPFEPNWWRYAWWDE